MKLSRFNVVSRSDDGGRILCNALTNVVLAVTEEDYKAIITDLRDRKDSEKIYQLRKGGLAVEDGLDEVSRLKYLANYAAYRGDYLDLRILPTEECNFRCAYCYESYQKSEMSEEIRKRMKRLVENKAPFLKRLFVGWFGGEPLMAFETIMELSRAFLETKTKFGFAYDSHITTNGYQLDRKTMLDLLSVDIRRIQVTIDGYREDHDLRRRLIDGGQTFDVLLDNIKTATELSNEEFQFIVRVNFDNDNVNGIPMLLDLLKEVFRGDTRFGVFFRPISKYGGTNQEIHKLNLVPKQEIMKIQIELEQQALGRGLRLNGGFEPPSLQSYLCYAAQPNSFVVGSDGSLYKCTVFMDDDLNKIGFVDEEGCLRTDLSKMAQWVGYKGDEDSVCGRCSLLPSCYGAACPAARLISKSRPCPIKLDEVKEGLRFLYHNSSANGKEVKHDVPE